ncbi:MAG: hypothetical protein CMK07_12230 [Ponticaulis sp.]|nr:hypothetical protein [Ponticaulis sp.]
MTQRPTDIDVLNHVTRTLIDSLKGYELASDMVEGHEALQNSLRARAADRKSLIGRFQDEVRRQGGEPETSSGLLGRVHRTYVKIASLFDDDVHAALSAVDDGEIFLLDDIEDRMKLDHLSAETRNLLNLAMDSAIDGDAFAGRLSMAC